MAKFPPIWSHCPTWKASVFVGKKGDQPTNIKLVCLSILQPFSLVSTQYIWVVNREALALPRVSPHSYN